MLLWGKVSVINPPFIYDRGFIETVPNKTVARNACVKLMWHRNLRPSTQKGERGGASTAVIIPEVVPSPSFVFSVQKLRRFEEEE